MAGHTNCKSAIEISWQSVRPTVEMAHQQAFSTLKSKIDRIFQKNYLYIGT